MRTSSILPKAGFAAAFDTSISIPPNSFTALNTKKHTYSQVQLFLLNVNVFSNIWSPRKLHSKLETKATSSRTASNSRCLWSGLETWQTRPRTPSCSFLKISSARSTLACLRLLITTFAPSCASLLAIANPMLKLLQYLSRISRGFRRWKICNLW